MGVVINQCAHSGHRTLKLAVTHEEVNGIKWFLVCLMTGTPSYGGSYKITVVYPSVSSHFSQK